MYVRAYNTMLVSKAASGLHMRQRLNMNYDSYLTRGVINKVG